ncbi:MAG: hypothetical protein F6K40_10105 [Okeania sp. SIO3I5]|uniref:hypothetical protein n=1 Tax=Okeania sp. SIO3I5 TaxID=2607805 RepID=UPI0013B813B1|nr:hypothetical protein [Okeania sp. SIO3I5]NEQ36607.1 hypothetical protein [Okeania sp. SIO3I5]
MLRKRESPLQDFAYGDYELFRDSAFFMSGIRLVLVASLIAIALPNVILATTLKFDLEFATLVHPFIRGQIRV